MADDTITKAALGKEMSYCNNLDLYRLDEIQNDTSGKQLVPRLIERASPTCIAKVRAQTAEQVKIAA